MKKRLSFFLLFFVYGMGITFYYLIPSYNLDGYCQLSMGFTNYAQLFLMSGRFITGGLWYLFGIINISHNLLSIISVLLTNVFLSLSVLSIYNSFVKYADNNLKKVILIISSLLIIYNPYVMEIFIYEESFIMALSIFSVIRAGELCFNKNYVLGGLLLILSNMMYQGMACLFIPYYFLLLLFENKDRNIKDFIKLNYKKFIGTVIIYGISLIIVFGLMKLYINVFNLDSIRNGNISIWENIKLIVNHIAGDVRTRQCMMMALIFNGVLGVLAAAIIIQLLLSKKYNLLLYLFIMVVLITICAFLPNLVMPSKSNYIFARMIVSCGALVGFVSLFGLLLDKRFIPVIVLIGCFFIYNSYNYLVSADHDYIRYKTDMKQLDLIRTKIDEYESINNIKINKIRYMVKPNDKVYFYFNNQYSVFGQKILHNDWGFVCGVQGVINNDLDVSYMTNSEYKTYFKDVIDDEFNENDLVFDGETLYILIY